MAKCGRRKVRCDWDCFNCKLPDCMRSATDILVHEDGNKPKDNRGRRGGRPPVYQGLTEADLRKMIREEEDPKIRQKYYTAISRLKVKEERTNGISTIQDCRTKSARDNR